MAQLADWLIDVFVISSTRRESKQFPFQADRAQGEKMRSLNHCSNMQTPFYVGILTYGQIVHGTFACIVSSTYVLGYNSWALECSGFLAIAPSPPVWVNKGRTVFVNRSISQCLLLT